MCAPMKCVCVMCAPMKCAFVKCVCVMCAPMKCVFVKGKLKGRTANIHINLHTCIHAYFQH